MRYKFVFLVLVIVAVCIFPRFIDAENYLLNGGQDSQIQYKLTQKLRPAPGTQALLVSVVSPAEFLSPTYSQRVQNLNITFNPPPTKRENKVDNRGNTVLVAAWARPAGDISATVSFVAVTSVKLVPLATSVPFPLPALPREVVPYLQATTQVPADDHRVIAKAKQITAGARSEAEAVQLVFAWVVDHMNYVLRPKDYGAKFSFATGEGNCQNYSHVAAALLRAVGIPVRIVNGVTINRAWDVNTTRGDVLTLNMAQGRHSWIEVYFPDLGWCPADPQQMKMFVSNRFIRLEVGIDNEETVQDGLIRWSSEKGSSGQPEFQEIIQADFTGDRVSIQASRVEGGPQKMLLAPEVRATPVFAAESRRPPATRENTSERSAPQPPEQVTEPIGEPAPPVTTVHAGDRQVLGNLNFPENIDFTFTRDVVETPSGSFELQKNNLVETAQYVTSDAQYAQTFILQNGMALEKIGLALHKFGGDGTLWLEVLGDQDGQPGERIATSDFLQLAEIPLRQGYSWVDFDFSKSAITLPGGRYWLALGYTGSPVINWFYSYGKPVGPIDGTRYKKLFDERWSRSLSFEFNYRVVGVAQ